MQAVNAHQKMSVKHRLFDRESESQNIHAVSKMLHRTNGFSVKICINSSRPQWENPKIYYD